MAALSPRRRGRNSTKSKFGRIEFVNKHIDDPNWIVFADVVVAALRRQRHVVSVLALNESPNIG